MGLVTVTSQLGSGGHEIARKLAGLMDYDFVTKGLIRNVFRTSLLGEEHEPSIREAAPSAIEGFILEQIRMLPESARAEAAAAAQAGLFVGSRAPADESDPDSGFDVAEIDEAGYQRLAQKLIERVADRSNAVILGRGGRPILQSREGVFHLLVVAPFPVRVERIMRRELCDEETARERVRESDAREERIFRDCFRTGYTDPTNYDLVVNTAHLTPRDAVSVVHQALVSSLKRRH